MKQCKTCLLHDEIKGVIILDDGTCNYCHWDKQMNKNYPISKKRFDEIVDWIKEQGKGQRYDAVIGLSGGCDSSYLLKKMVESGVHCLGVHWDNNWNTKIAWDNMVNITDHLGVDFRVRHISQEVYNQLCKSFLFASTPDADIPNDIALATVLYQEAESENINVILNGHSFRTEGTCPTGWTYMDGKYIQSVNQQYFKTDLSSFPNMLLRDWLRWMPIHRIRPLYHLDYQKEKAKNELGFLRWYDYGGHHAENHYTKFVGTYLWPKKFDQDLRYVSLSAQIRNGLISKQHAFDELNKPYEYSDEELMFLKKRLSLSDTEFTRILQSPVKTYHEYSHYDFSKLGDVFSEFSDVLPQTFIDKYVKKIV